MRALTKIDLSQIAFLFLFAAEFTFYLLILQTGIVEYHHSTISEIWMVPAGGMIGIVLSVFFYRERHWLIPFLLLVQLLLAFDYANANMLELFLLGLISGLTAPMLIARIDRFAVVVIALGLSYAYGTYAFDIPALQRTSIAILLSVVALGTSLFSQMGQVGEKSTYPTLYSAVSIFLWLLLDASLFETLSRNSSMHLWGETSFTWNIVILHLVGLVAAYKARDWKHNDSLILALFVITFILYSLGWQIALSFVYPFVISYYNVIILRQLMSLPYPMLAFMALALWAASGLGLFIVLTHSFVPAWIVLILLGLTHLYKRVAPSPAIRLGGLGSLFLIPFSRSH